MKIYKGYVIKKEFEKKDGKYIFKYAVYDRTNRRINYCNTVQLAKDYIDVDIRSNQEDKII
jgi:hypothetical protein